MTTKTESSSVRILPEDVANKIAAGEVVERPASVVKELVENALDAGARRVTVRLVAAGRRLIEVLDNGHGMSEQNALLAIERHATSKIRSAEDLEDIRTMGFRGEALASIASVSRFELITRRAKDEAATRLRIDGGILRGVEEVGAPVGTRVSVNRLYFNTPVRAKFLKGITTELSHCVDVVQRHSLAREGVGFQLIHNEKLLLDIPEHATLRERVALIWGLNFAKDMVALSGEQAGFTVRGVIGTPVLTRAQRSHQFFFMNGRPVTNRSLQYGFEDGYRTLLTIGRHPVGMVLMETHPRFVDVNIHPTKREIRFRDERAARDAVRDVVRDCLGSLSRTEGADTKARDDAGGGIDPGDVVSVTKSPFERDAVVPLARGGSSEATEDKSGNGGDYPPSSTGELVEELGMAEFGADIFVGGDSASGPEQAEIPGVEREDAITRVAPDPVYVPVDSVGEAPLQIFDTYLLAPSEDRLLIIDQHALHERLNYDGLVSELQDHTYESQQLMVPIMVEVAPSQVDLLNRHLELFSKLGVDIEPFGGNTFQVTAVCTLYDDGKVDDLVYRVLDELGQGELFDKDDFMADLLRLATRACRASIRAGDRLTPEERRGLLDGFRRLRPPYTCPHGRPIITELTLHQMEKSFRRIQ